MAYQDKIRYAKYQEHTVKCGERIAAENVDLQRMAANL